MEEKAERTIMAQLLALLIQMLLGFFFLVGSRPSIVPPDMGSEPLRSVTNIYAVEVIVQESMPMQVQLHVRGEHPDGCELPVIVEQMRSGNEITVMIYRELPPDVFCPMILQPYEDTIQLDGNFEPGDYVFRVNDTVVEKTL
jgi:hypothetical protein